jgi:hypothetical protein
MYNEARCRTFGLKKEKEFWFSITSTILLVLLGGKYPNFDAVLKSGSFSFHIIIMRVKKVAICDDFISIFASPYAELLYIARGR